MTLFPKLHLLSVYDNNIILCNNNTTGFYLIFIFLKINLSEGRGFLQGQTHWRKGNGT